MSGAKNASARASAAMRGPSRQTTARLTAGAFGVAPRPRAQDPRAPAPRRRRRRPRASADCPGVSNSAGDFGVGFQRLAAAPMERAQSLRTAPCRDRPAAAISPVDPGVEIVVGHVEQPFEIGRARRRVRSAISASAKRPSIRSISRMPRCQARNSSLRRRRSSPSLDRVVPVMRALATPKARTGRAGVI